MIQIIIILAIMQMGFNLLFKPKYNQLACGLFGGAADDVNKLNINKLKILGIYNDIRGGHSCGMSIDGDIIIGTYKDKLYKDFISTYNISAPQMLPVVLGHTRMATGGTHNESNAHPFGFGTNNDYYDFIGTHNGTLHNEDELAEEFNVSTKATIFKDNKTTVRHKIDSEILLEIIYENGFKVLEKYQGAAALAMYNTKKPNTLYLYHGASSKFQNVEAVEERPLFYYQESENVVYYSSLKNSLEAINDTNGEIKEFEHNVVYEIRNGNVEKAKKHIIDRSERSQINSSCSVTPVTNYSKNYRSNDYWKDKKWCNVTRTWIQDDKTENTKLLNSMDLLYENWVNYISKTNSDITKIYYENLRFYQNKKLLDGIYVLNNQNDLVYVCLYINSFDIYFDYLENSKNLKKNTPLYFVKGIRLISEKDYTILQNTNTFEKFNLAQLSHCSVYPIRDIKLKNSICYYKGEHATLNFSPMHTLNVIQLTNGKCILISERKIENISYFLSDDKLLLNNINFNIIESKENQCDDDVVVELYKENLLATIEYCIDDCDMSLTNNYVKTQIKSKLKEIEKFVIKLLTI